jgi:hypothetical protein
LIVAMLASKTDLRIADSCSSYTLLKSCNEEMGEPTERGGGSDTMRWWWWWSVKVNVLTARREMKQQRECVCARGSV